MLTRIQQRCALPLLALLVVCAAAQNLPHQIMSHEGNTFTRTEFGNFPCAPQGRVSMALAGDVTVRGQARDDCYYRIRQKVSAQTEKRATELMQGFAVRGQLQNDTSYFKVVPFTAGVDTLDIEVAVPRGSREVVAISQVGSVKAFDLDGALTIESGAGNLEADRINGPTSCRTDGGNIKIGRVNNTLRTYSGGGQIRIANAGGETWTDTAGGEIFVTEVHGPLHASTSGGNIEVERAASVVRAFSMLGLIDIQQAGGLVTAETRGGSIQVSGGRGARCEAGSGTIRVRNSDGPIRLNTMAGNILAELVPGRPLQESILSTLAGDITVLIPSNLAVTVQARNETQGARGRIVSDFSEIQTRPFQPGLQPRVATGSLNGGGPLLRVTAAGGNIYLKRLRY
jgi:DUF4097 and DUF4098 domain-containing protein YvlB